MNEEQDINNQEFLDNIQKQSTFYGFIALAFGILFTLCFYDFYNNFNGILYPIFVIGMFTLSYIVLKRMKIAVHRSSNILTIGAVLLSISSFITMNWFIVMCNTIGIGILFTVFLCKQFYTDNNIDGFQYFKRIVIVWFGAIFSVNYPVQHLISKLKPIKTKDRKVKSILLGVVSGLLALCVILPLLASADMIFESIVSNIFSYFVNPFEEKWLGYLLQTVIAGVIFYSLFCYLGNDNNLIKTKDIVKRDGTSVTIMCSFVALTYVLFSGIQIVFLFGGRFLKLPKGITYSEYAHQGFFQLVFVVIINLGIVVICIEKFLEHIWLKRGLIIISSCTFVMIASAAYRMILYVSVYHLTFLRILVLWFLILVTVLMGSVTYFIFHPKFHITRFFFYTTLIFYLVFAFIKPDNLIANYNISQVNQLTREDIRYLTRLSEDVAPTLAKIESDKLDDTKYRDDSVVESAQSDLNHYFEQLYQDYDNGIRRFNLSRYNAYKSAKEYKYK